MKVSEIDTPALLIEQEIVLRNLQKMQSYADAAGVSLRSLSKGAPRASPPRPGSGA